MTVVHWADHLVGNSVVNLVGWKAEPLAEQRAVKKADLKVEHLVHWSVATKAATKVGSSAVHWAAKMVELKAVQMAELLELRLVETRVVHWAARLVLTMVEHWVVLKAVLWVGHLANLMAEKMAAHLVAHSAANLAVQLVGLTAESSVVSKVDYSAALTVV